MAETTKIQWCDATFNPWIGCTKVSPGCAHCYAERDFDLRKHVAKWGKGQPRHRTSEAYWKQPLKWDRAAARDAWELKTTGRVTDESGEAIEWHRPRIFCGSLCDWLDDEVPVEWLADLLDLIRRTPNLDWLLLTKRPKLWTQRIDRQVLLRLEMMKEPATAELREWLVAWLNGTPPANVWIGTTVEDQARADERIPALLKIPARVRFLSVEPMLGPVRIDFSVRIKEESCTQSPIDWVICGGESGPKARPMHPAWARSLRDQCAAAKVPFLFKQHGEWWPAGARIIEGKEMVMMGNEAMYRVGKRAAGRLLDGREHNEFPR